MKNKSIDINQRIPLDTLHIALESYLDDNFSNDYVLEQLRLEFDGQNRLKKALRIVNKVIQKNPLNDLLLENTDQIKIAIKKKSDRDIILIALLNSVFPFSFDVLHTFGKFFAVQDVVNTEIIKKSISNRYGGNRATENGLYSVIPMFIEANFFKRPKTGIYEWTGGVCSSNTITKKIYQNSFLVNHSMVGELDNHLRDPYFKFIN